MQEHHLISGTAALLIALMYLAYPGIERRATAYQHLWIPVTSGIAVGYVFLYLLPKLGDYSAIIKSASNQGWQQVGDHRIYFFALLGFALYYLVDQSRIRRDGRAEKTLWIHGTAFFIYALLVGDLLATMSDGRNLSVVVTACVLSLHLLGVNHQLRTWATRAFDRLFRWWFAVAVMLGWSLGALFSLPMELIMAVNGILAGGIITNVMVEKLPAGNKAKLTPFISGVLLSIGATILLNLFP